MKNRADYSLYKCPYSHIEKECGHELKGPEGFDTDSVWCACGFSAPAFCLDPEELKLELINAPRTEKSAQTDTQQLRAEIAAMADTIEECFRVDGNELGLLQVKKLRQLSSV